MAQLHPQSGRRHGRVDAQQYLVSLGACLSIDNFGTGTSRLAELGALLLDEVKIDRSLTKRLGGDERERIVTAMDAVRARPGPARRRRGSGEPRAGSAASTDGMRYWPRVTTGATPSHQARRSSEAHEPLRASVHDMPGAHRLPSGRESDTALAARPPAGRDSPDHDISYTVWLAPYGHSGASRRCNSVQRRRLTSDRASR
jgi:hypothetical protein